MQLQDAPALHSPPATPPRHWSTIHPATILRCTSLPTLRGHQVPLLLLPSIYSDVRTHAAVRRARVTCAITSYLFNFFSFYLIT